MWIGIHEPIYCRMHFSQEMGTTCKSYELDAQKFFPNVIYSMPYAPLQIIDYWTRKIYQLEGSNPLAQWRLVRQLPNHDNELSDISVERYISQKNKYNSLYVKRLNGSIDTLLNLNDILVS